MVHILNSDEKIEPVYEDRNLCEGQLVCYRSAFINGTGATQAYCYVDEVLDNEKKIYHVKEIRWFKHFDKNYQPPTPREFVVTDLNVLPMIEKVGDRLGWYECLTEITPEDVSNWYGAPWKQILEHDTDLKRKKMWRK